MNAIKTKDQQNHTALKFFTNSSTVNSRRRHTYVGAAVGSSDIDGNSWKQNAAQSQKRTRDRLTALMFACGKQAGLSRLPLNRSASVSQFEKINNIRLFSASNRLCLVKQVI